MNWQETLLQAQQFAARFRLADPAGPALGKAGFHGSAQAGSSLEYKDFREYQPGDDLRYLDWSAYARSDRLIVKRYHDEVTPHLDLLLDGSASMDLPETDKGDAARFLAAFFATVALNSGYSCQTWLAGNECKPLSPVAEPTRWPQPRFESLHSPAPALVNFSPSLRRQGMRILITDSLWPENPRSVLAALGSGASLLLVIRLLASSDLSPVAGGYVRLRDSETGINHQLLLNEGTHANYRLALNRHMSAWNEAGRGLGVHITTVQAEDFMRQPLFEDAIMRHVLTVKKG